LFFALAVEPETMQVPLMSANIDALACCRTAAGVGFMAYRRRKVAMA
jgi:hypothetical protein